jgi:hypothetical protein
MARDEAAAGGVLDQADVDRYDEIIARFNDEGTPPLPSDYDIAKELNIIPFYTRVYRPGSDVAHYSIGSALDGFAELTHEELIGSVSLEMPDPERAADVLIRAALTYGMFLEKSEPTIRHGLTAGIVKLMD